MLQNKIYQNFILEIFETFLMILLGLTLIALTVQAVNFLDLIVENGYLVTTYFKYSFKFIWNNSKIYSSFFLVALIIFTIKAHSRQ